MKAKAWRAVTTGILAMAIGLAGVVTAKGFWPNRPLSAMRSPILEKRQQEPRIGPYRFVAFGDWGAGTPFQKAVAAQLNREFVLHPFDAVLLLGDNFYPDGNVAKYGQRYFTDMYPELINAGVRFIVALGNHDTIFGHQEDQIRFFKMPGHYYAVQKPGIEFLVIDTNNFAKSKVQQQWLIKTLDASKSPWKVVIGHHPIYSSGEHGMNVGLKQTLEPILIKSHTDLYLAGHDHDYERFSPIQGVQHIVSGGGGAYLRNFETNLPASVIRVKANHFLAFELSGLVLKMRAIDKTGKVIDEAEWKKAAQPLVTPESQPNRKAS